MTSYSRRLKKSSSSKALHKLLEERRVDIGSNMQEVRSCSALPLLKSNVSLEHAIKRDDEKSLISESDDSSV